MYLIRINSFIIFSCFVKVFIDFDVSVFVFFSFFLFLVLFEFVKLFVVVEEFVFVVNDDSLLVEDFFVLFCFSFIFFVVKGDGGIAF